MKKSRYLLIFIVIFFITLLIIDPVTYSNSIFNGIYLFFYNIFPTLFPFMFFSRLLQALEFQNIISKFIYKPINKLFHTTKYSSYVFIISLFCGYPLSSKILADLYSCNKIDKDEVLAISSFTNNSNPLFIIGTIGAIMLKNVNFAMIILVSHYTSSIINGILHSTLKLKNIQNSKPNFLYSKKIDISDTMTNSVSSVLLICGYIIIFNFICDALINTKILSKIAFPFEFIYSKIGLQATLPYYKLISIIEVTRGIKEISSLTIQPVLLLPTICSLVSFGGICINLQCYSFLQNTGIKLKDFLIIKITQAIIAYVICFLVCLILKV